MLRMSASTCTHHVVLPLLHDLLHFVSSLHVLIGVVAASVPRGLGERNESMSGDKKREREKNDKILQSGQMPSEFKQQNEKGKEEDVRRGRGKSVLQISQHFV